MQFVVGVVSNTPIWAWLLFAYLIMRAVRGLSPRQSTLSRILLMPVIFFVWAVVGIGSELKALDAAFGAFVALLLVGLAIGAALAGRLPRSWRDPATDLIHRPGSANTLVLVVISIVSKYCMTVAMSLHPDLTAQTSFCLLYGGFSGLIDGIFWGITAVQLNQALGSSQFATSPAQLDAMRRDGPRGR
jgi:putative effector of murein hydrolase LrgA (UPF0299 family)